MITASEPLMKWMTCKATASRSVCILQISNPSMKNWRTMGLLCLLLRALRRISIRRSLRSISIIGRWRRKCMNGEWARRWIPKSLGSQIQMPTCLWATARTWHTSLRIFGNMEPSTSMMRRCVLPMRVLLKTGVRRCRPIWISSRILKKG